MRILHVTDHYPPVLGGIEVHVAALADQQSRGGHQVTVLTCVPAGDARDTGLLADDSAPVTVRRVRSPHEGARQVEDGFDLVHGHLSVVAPFTGPLAALAAQQGVPTVVTVHSLWGGTGPVATAAAALCGLRRAPVLWAAVSRAAADQVSQRLPGRPPVLVLPNAVQVAPRPGPPGHGPDTPVRLVSTMRIAHRKRPLPLLRLYEELQRTSDVPLHLTIVGDGSQRVRLQRHVRRSRQPGEVTITGRLVRSEVLGLLAQSDIYVAPAVLESFGLAALEARCVGLPVVGYATSGLSDFIGHGREGLLGHSDQELLAHVRHLVDDVDLRARISEHNRTTPTEMTWHNTLERHSAAYTLAGSAQPAASGYARLAAVGV